MRGETNDIIEAVRRDELQRAKGLLARAHGVLEIDNGPSKLTEEIADFLGWAREHCGDPRTKRSTANSQGEKR